MDTAKVFETVAATAPEAMKDVSDEALITAAVYAADQGYALTALTIGIEIGIRETTRDATDSLLGRLLEHLL
jgi:hypothetical protein